jgi:hypothetical protein
MEGLHLSATEQCGPLAAGGEVPPFSSPAEGSPTPRQKDGFFSASAAVAARGGDAGEEGLGLGDRRAESQQMEGLRRRRKPHAGRRRCVRAWPERRGTLAAGGA